MVKNIVAIIASIGGIGLVVFCINNLITPQQKESAPIENRKHEMKLYSPSGEELGEMHMYGEFDKKDSGNGFYFNDHEGGVLFDVTKNGEVRYFKSITD